MVEYGREHELATGIYGLKDLERIWIPRKGYTFVSEKYPKGVPRTMGRFTVGVPPSAASTARALTGDLGPHARAAALLITSGVPAITAGNVIRDPSAVNAILAGASTAPSSYGTAGTGLAAGGTALGRGAPSVGSVPGGELGLGGIGTDITATGKGIMDTITQYLPLAVKVVVAVIVIKIVLSLVRGRK
jgi:hypothetical protein